jgi:hypothetical protein
VILTLLTGLARYHLDLAVTPMIVPAVMLLLPGGQAGVPRAYLVVAASTSGT